MEKLICRKCGKEIKGITLIYSRSGKWECSDCNKSDVLCCEIDSKVVFSHPESGYSYDSEHAKRYLQLNKIYHVKNLEVGRYISSLTLKEFPNVSFNTVHFERCV